MSISDRLDEIEARRAQANSSLNGRHMLVGKDVPEMLDALRAVLDLCDKALAVKVSGSTEGDAAMAAFASAALSAITADLGEES